MSVFQKTIFITHEHYSVTGLGAPLAYFIHRESDVIDLHVCIFDAANQVLTIKRRILCNRPTLYVVVKRMYSDIQVVDFFLASEHAVPDLTSRRVRAR